MKKLFIIFSLFIVHYSFAQAQDTIILNSGQKIAGKVISVTNGVIYFAPSDSTQASVKTSNVNYIRYKDGAVYTTGTNADNTAPKSKKQKTYILLSAGPSHPWTFSGYGANTYQNDPEDGYGYSGYADNGYEISATWGYSIAERGWELTAMASYIRNPIEASGYMQQTIADFFLEGNLFSLNNVSAIGNYAYSNLPVFVGFTKNWGAGQPLSTGFSLMFGDLITYTPAMHGIVTGSSLYGQYAVSYYFDMNTALQNNLDVMLKLYIDGRITRRIFFRASIAFQLSGLTNTGTYQYTNMSTGDVVGSGKFPGNLISGASNGFFTGLTELTLGVGYKL